ncbi:DUF1269 domain-containing protein [Dictyobacter aurantiacus]|uniref:DUF1269 domain-containing protein n=1 Tax=Dictyobacter aurantiacus TaxID=1936993 RepID=A0A401ZPZ8_9CHLR|nr:DUF1269 domain-containing protein [Dictyobacter aurantiacus]GCE08836.1 hypothetical protein KDAU_61650 [Dictyobacter aurantiacus]
MSTRPNKNNMLVVGVFENVAKAKQAQKEIEVWDETQSDIKLGGSTVIYKDEKGKIKDERSSKFDWKKGALIGLLLVPLTGGLLLPVYGAVAGLAVTWLKGIKREDVDQVASAIKQGNAALAVLCDEYEIKSVSEEMKRLGSKNVIGYAVPESTSAQVEHAVNEAASKGEITPEHQVSQ